MILHITRHGQVLDRGAGGVEGVDYPHGDPPLSSLGRRQARFLGDRLKELGFDGPVFTSPYRRAAGTAQIVAEVTDSEVFLATAMRESNGSGEHMAAFQGANAAELRAEFPRARPGPDFAYPWWTVDAETGDNVEERTGRLVDTLAADGRDALLVGHAASGGGATRYVLRQRAPEMLDEPRFSWNCMLTSLRLLPQFERLRLASTSHLPAEAMTSNARTREEVLVILQRRK